MPREIKKYEGHLVFTGHEMLKINNPEYDSDDESFGARRPPELIEVPEGPEIKIIYKIELDAIKSDPASTVTVYTAVGEMVRHPLELHNPTFDSIQFKVNMIGRGLDGPEYIHVEPQETAIYEFTYIGQNAECSLAGEIYFESGVTGEFWYQINYQPEDPAEETFGPIEAEFGGWAEFEIPFVNQSDARTTVDIDLSSRNFILDPNESKSFEIESNESRKIKFIFIPTTLSDDHKCLVSFKSPHIGCWTVKLTGSGVPPSAFDTTRIATTLNKPVTVMLPFRNPAEEVAHISIELIDIENETNARSGSEILRSVTPNKTLQLLLKRQERIALSPNEVVDIPIRHLVFKPSRSFNVIVDSKRS